MKQSNHWLPTLVVSVAVIWLAAAAYPRSDSAADWNVRAFGRLPVVQEGRIMPLDTVGRLALMSLSHRQTLYYGSVGADGKERDKKSYPASKWLLDCMALSDQDMRMEMPIVKVDDPRLVDALGLQPRKTALYSIRELSPGLRPFIKGDQEMNPSVGALLNELKPLMEQEKEGLPIYEYRIFRIENDQVLNLVQLKPRDGLRYSFAEIIHAGGKELEDEFKRIHKIKPGERNLFDTKVAELYQHVQLLIHLTAWRGPLAIPPGDGSDSWRSLQDQIVSEPLASHLSTLAQLSYLEMLSAYHLGAVDPLKGDKPDPAMVARFNDIVAGYHDELDKALPGVMSRVRLEAWFNEFAPFLHCSILYALIAILGCLSWLVSFRTLNRAALAAMVVVFAVHTVALVCRMYIQGRPPVTNLYSSAIFIGWGCVLTCLFVEVLCRYSLALIVGSVTGSLSLVVAHFLSLDGDTLGMLQAVLDTNFWLATHVVCITLGYTATFVAGFMGVAYILLGVLTPVLNRDIRQIFPAEAGVTGTGRLSTMLTKMTYGVICFAMLLSFTGTVLGGIWADQSWGRFWGWDPKENGALLIVIWNALILHSRWGGLIKQRGIAVLAVFGNVITAWSWFGTNLLGIGLHAYGFMKGAMFSMIAFDAAMLAIMALGLLPLAKWRSFQPTHAATTASEPVLAGVD